MKQRLKERRRGSDLEEALLDAAWTELTERGYSGLTMDGVAARADTSRPVLARRWEGKNALAIAAIRQQMAKSPLAVPDRGDVRTELLEFMKRASARASAIAAAFTMVSSEYFQETSSLPQDWRVALAGGESSALDPILQRAVERGEIDAKKLVAPVVTLLTDLFRYHAIMTFSPPSPALRTSWVDCIFLPLVRKADQ